MLDFQVPIEGLDRASDRLDGIANRIAGAGLSDPPQDSVDLSAEAVALLDTRNQFETNLKVLETQDQMTGSLLNMTV